MSWGWFKSFGSRNRNVDQESDPAPATASPDSQQPESGAGAERETEEATGGDDLQDPEPLDWWADVPLRDEIADELRRTNFAQVVATCLAKQRSGSPRVIGVAGPWGSGKSTTTNFILRRLKIMRPDLHIVHFDAWMVSSRQSLVEQLFAEIEKAIFPKETDLNTKTGRIWKRFSPTLIKGVAKNVTILAAPAGAVAAAAGFPAAVTAAGAAGIAASSVEALASIAETVKHPDTDTPDIPPTLMESKAALQNALGSHTRQVLIVIDDIDRLEEEEVRTVFQLVKAVADFPNVNYMLAYDRKQVSRCLGGSEREASAFLEKIVDRFFDLPEPMPKVLSQFLQIGLNRLSFPSTSVQAQNRFNEVFDNILLPGLPTIRSAKKFIGTVEDHLPGVISGGLLNVDKADYLLWHFIRIRAPEVYDLLLDSERAPVGGPYQKIYNSENFQEAATQRTEDKLDKLEYPLQDLVRQAFSALHDTGNGDEHEEKRYASEHWRPVYHTNDYTNASLPEDEWDNMKSHVLKADDDWLQLLDHPTNRAQIVASIADRAGEFAQSSDVATSLLSQLFSWGERKAGEHNPKSTLEPLIAVYRISNALLSSIVRMGGDSVGALMSAYLASQCKLAAGFVVGMEYAGMWEQRRQSGDWSTRESLEPIVTVLGYEIANFIKSGKIWKSESPDDLEHVWHWLEPENRKEWHDNLADNPEDLAQYFNHIMGARRRDPSFTQWGSIDRQSKWYKAVLALPESLLSDAGRWARAKYLSDADGEMNRLSRRNARGTQSELSEQEILELPSSLD